MHANPYRGSAVSTAGVSTGSSPTPWPTSAGSRSRSRCRPVTANGGSGPGKGFTAFRRRTTSRSSRRPARLPCTRRKTGWPAPQVFRLFEDSRGNVWVSTIAAEHERPGSLGTPQRAADATWPAHRGSPRSRTTCRGRSAKTAPATSGSGFNNGLARYSAGHFHVLHRDRGTAARRDREHPRGPLGPALARVGARRARSRRRPRSGATHLRHATRPRRGCRATTPR